MDLKMEQSIQNIIASINNYQKSMSSNSSQNWQCPVHKKIRTILCMNPGCKGTRLCCEQCRLKDHSHHVYKEIKDLNTMTARLETKNEGAIKNANIHNSLKATTETLNKSTITLNQLDRYLQKLMEIVPNKLLPPVKYLSMLSLGELANYSSTIGSDQLQQFEHIAGLYRFLSTASIHSLDEVSQIIDVVGEKINDVVHKLEVTIENAISQFYYQIQKCELKNWQEVYREKLNKNIKQKQKANDGKQKQKHNHIISLLEDSRGEQRKQAEKKQIFVDNQELNQIIEKMFDEVFQIRPIANPHQKGDEKNRIIPAVLQQTDKFQGEEGLNRYSRFVFSAQNANKKITKNQIMTLISKLMIDRNYTHSLKEFILEGPNQFDIDCLKKLVSCFPNLTKFNYIWNFQEAGLRLQKEQAFFEIPRSLQKDMKNFELTQDLLDTYGQLEHLQNISINQVEVFAFKEFKIKNKKILHLTIGEYVQPNQQEILPNCLKNQALLFNGLITLNIFNVKKVDGGFMQSIIHKNLESLRNMWLSECIELEESFYHAIERSKLESIMFDQIKKINHTISVPSTLRTLIIDNCELHHSQPFYGLSKAINLTNFSIFDSIFHETKQIGDQVLQELSEIPNCKIEYLSVAECQSVTNQSLTYLQKMSNLKELCIDNTNICLYQLSKYRRILDKINKLAIVGLEVRKESEQELKSKNFPSNYVMIKYTLEKILKKSPNLQLISLKFEDDLASIDMQLFKNVQHLSISALNSQKYKKKLLKQFVEALKGQGIKVNIV